MPADRPPDLRRACWRCTHWGGLVARAHARCTRLNAPLQASPMFGCAYWAAGAGDALASDWVPQGYKVPVKVVIWGSSIPAQERPPLPVPDARPTNDSDAFKFDQQQEASAWRVADALMTRARIC